VGYKIALTGGENGNKRGKVHACVFIVQNSSFFQSASWAEDKKRENIEET
jgi:hypothetical protein